MTAPEPPAEQAGRAPDVAARCSCTATHCLVSCVICGRVSYDGGCPNETVSDREAVLERERLVQQKVLEQYERKIETLQAHRPPAVADSSWQPFTPATTTVPTARLTEWAGLLRQLSVHVPLEGPALTRALEAAQLMQWWAGQEVVREPPIETNRTTSEEDE